MTQRRVTVRIEGVVQGVCFRDYTRREAASRRLSGWVRNLPDGSVEAVLEGEADLVGEMILWLHKGSPQAQVSRVLVVEEQPLGEKTPFLVRYGNHPV